MYFSAFSLKTRFQAISSDKKLPYEEQFPRNAIYNSEKKNPIEKNSSEAKQILNSWLKNEKEAYAIKEKSIHIYTYILAYIYIYIGKKAYHKAKKTVIMGKFIQKALIPHFGSKATPLYRILIEVTGKSLIKALIISVLT